MTTEEDDHTEQEEQEEKGFLRRALPVTRRDVMRAAGTSGVLAGYVGTGAAQEDVPSCGCQEITAGDSQCFEESAAEDCFYCKIDPIPENGESCTIEGTSIEITVVEDSHCIDVSDPSGEVGAVALKSGSFCPCTIHEDVGDGDRICTLTESGDRCRNAISHITVEVCPQRITTSGELLNCTEASIDVDNVETITLEVEFYECDTLVKKFTDGGPNDDDDADNNAISASIDLTAQARCYCTPTVMNVYEGDSTASEDLITTVESDLPEGFCEPTLDATGDCASVTATATFPSAMPDSEQDELLDGCPITATLHTDCDEMVEKTFTSADRVPDTDSFEVTWDVGTDYSCYCTPTMVSYRNDDGGATLSDQNDDLLTAGFCAPEPTVDATCTSVDVSVSNGLAGCPIDATLSFVEDDCADSSSVELNADNSFSATIPVPCYCTPDQVTLEWTLLDGTTQSMTVDAAPSDGPCEPNVDVTFACDVVSFSGTSVPGCDVMVKLFFDDCSTVMDTFTAADDGTVEGSFDLDALDRCYCTPSHAEIYEVLDDGSTNLVETETAPTDLDCSPDATVDADCTQVDVTINNGLEGCPIDATLTFSDDCSDIGPLTLDSSNSFSDTFDVPCYCDPATVELKWTADGTTQTDSVDATTEDCVADVTVTPDCEALSVSGSTVPGCDVEVEIDFHGDVCESISQTFTGASDGSVSGSIDLEAEGRCYCTPQSYTVYEVRDGSRLGSGTTTDFGDPFIDDEHCEPDLDASFTCDTVTVEASGLIEGCPVTATLYFVDDCVASRTVTLTTTNTSDEFDITDLCGCPPDRVEFTDADSGRELDSIDAPILNCVCETFTDVCRIDEGQIEDLCNGNDVTVECGDAGQITFEGSEAECDGGELICFNFTSTFEVFRVFVKGGGGPDAGNEYIWSCGTFDSDDPEPDIINFETDDQTYNGKLCANENPNNNKQTAVSHIDFSVCAEDLD